jgi:assimilatory nitrate reductase catalytic subunit
VVFSAATWSEKEGTYTNSERRCNYARKAVEPLADTKSDFHIVLEFSKYFEGVNEKLFPNWEQPIDAFNEWKKVSSGRLCDYSGMSYKLIEELGGIQWPCNEKYPKGKARLYDEDMPCPTDDGKAKLLALDWLPLSEPCNISFPLTLNTGRTVEQWHTRTKTKTISILNDLAPEAWIEINPLDAKKLEVSSGDRIDISSIRGRISDIIVRESQNIRQGSIFVPFHYNEQLINTITKAEFDPKSFEPNFKQCAVQLHSAKVPNGIKLKEQEISGVLEHIVIKNESILVQKASESSKLKIKD